MAHVKATCVKATHATDSRPAPSMLWMPAGLAIGLVIWHTVGQASRRDAYVLEGTAPQPSSMRC